MTDTLPIGTHVQKVTGYRWPGVVVSVFQTLSGKTRYVVECTVPDVAGALHIYAPEQIAVVGGADAQDGRTPWRGGRCPVDPEAIVMFRMRDGREEEDRAGRLEWHYEHEHYDIVAYRVVKGAPADE